MNDLSLWGLFVSAFLSATLLPGGSEIVLGLLNQDALRSPWQLVTVATLGNTLGAMTTWWIGYLLARYYATESLGAERERAVERLRRWGHPLLLLSWLPAVGDPLCLAAGWLRIPFLTALGYIVVGKALRYTAVAMLTG